MAEQAPSTLEEVKSLKETVDNFSDLGRSLTSISATGSTALGILEFAATKAKVSLDGLGNWAKNNQFAFSAIAHSVLSVGDAFQGLGGVVDSSNIGTFSQDFIALKQALDTTGPAAEMARAALDKAVTAVNKGDNKELQRNVADALKIGPRAVADALEGVFKRADRMAALNASIIHLAANTGTLNEVYEKSGDGLKNISLLTSENTKMMEIAQRATGATREQMSSYWATLGSIPGALQSIKDGNSNVAGSFNIFIDAIKIAHATGRTVKEISDDLKNSVTNYGVSMENAAKFTTRISELNNKYKIPYDEMKKSLLAVTDTFQNYANAGDSAAKMTDDAANIINKYIGGLKESGMTGKHATEVIKDMTSAINTMGVAQRAFLSAQTGGPGGLMGAARIEKMLMEGNLEKVQDLVMQSMKKQFGKVVTLEEGTQSDAAEATRQKQIMLLKQGPLGQMIKTDQDATKFLNSMAAGDKGALKQLDTNILKNTIDKGTAVEEQTITLLTPMSQDLSAIQNDISIMTGLSLQRTIGVAQTPGGSGVPQNQFLTERMRGAKLEGEQFKAEYYDKTPRAAIDDINNPMAKKLGENVQRGVDDARSVVKSGITDITDIARRAHRPTTDELAKRDIAEQTKRLNERKLLQPGSRGYRPATTVGQAIAPASVAAQSTQTATVQPHSTTTDKSQTANAQIYNKSNELLDVTITIVPKTSQHAPQTAGGH